MEVRVLGPLQVFQDGRLWSPGGPKERKLLAILALRLGEVVSVDTIADALWDGSPPRSAVKSVQAYVTRLRAALDSARSDAGVIDTCAPGYRLVRGRVDLDADVFTDLVRRAREEVDRGEPEPAERCLNEAFAVWRGEPYAEYAGLGYFAAEVRRLSETKLAGLEVRLAAGLALGRHAELVAEAEALCADHPLHEGFWCQLVTALYRAGRQADALAAFSRVRVLLADEVGADPGIELRTLHQQVLRQDPLLAAPKRPGAAVPALPSELDPAGRLFVGRVAELVRLRQAWSEVAAHGRPRLLVIAGPAGSGRTRLVGELAAQLHAEGVAVHYGRLAAGLAVIEDLDEATVAQLGDVAGWTRMLCVATYDPSGISAVVGREILAAASEELVLTPLGHAEVAQIVFGIAATTDPGLVEEVTVASGCWPGAVERIAAQLVGERSTQRVATAVERARPASRALAAARNEVADAVRDLAWLRVWHAQTLAGSTQIACPYKGLATYEVSDAPLFHGREELVARLCARLVDTTFVAVVGPSGAGKSSLVRAGLLPALADGVLPGLVGLPLHLLAHGDAPLPVIEGPAMVVVDQFEEIFTGSTGAAARDLHLDQLTALATRPGMRVVVVLRSDFVGACAVHRRLAELIGDGTVLVGPMRAEETRRAVELPARHVGLFAEPAFVDAIVSDVEKEPGALPLLSTVLVEVWQRRSGAALTAAAYHRSGGVSGAVARLGEAAYAGMDEATQGAVRRLLVRLAETGEDGTMVRRRVPRTELGTDPATGSALDVLVGRRLLTTGERGVEVTHEALLTHWPRLAGWLADDEQGRALRRHLAPAALDWHHAGRPDTELYRGARLAGALDWIGERLVDLTSVEHAFLTAGRDYSDRALQEEMARGARQARGRRRLRAALAATLGLLLVASGAAWFALDRQRAAAEASRQSLALRLGTLALATPDLDRSLLLAVQAVRTHDDRETRGDLLAVLNRSPQALRQVRPMSDQAFVEQVALTRDGSTVVAGGGGYLFTWPVDALDGNGQSAEVGQRVESIIRGPNPDDVFVAVAVDVFKRSQAVIQWNARTRTPVQTYSLPDGISSSTRRLALTADQRVLAVPTIDRLLLLYDVGASSVRQVKLDGPPGDLWPLGSMLVTVSLDSAVAMIVDPATAQIVRRLPLPFAGNVVPSPDGHSLLVFAKDRATLVATDDGRILRELSGATRTAAAAAFSADGSLLAIGGNDQLVDVWDAASGDLRDTLHGHAAPVHGLAFTADGQTLYTASQDGSVIAWDVAGDRSFATRRSRAAALPPPPATTDIELDTVVDPFVTWSRDGGEVYVAAADGSAAALIDVASGRVVRSLPPVAIDANQPWPVGDLDRQAIFTTSADGLLLRHDLRTAAVTQSYSAEPPLASYLLAVSGDGRVLADQLEGLNAEGNSQVYGVDLLDPQTLTVNRRLPPLAFHPWYMWLNHDGSLLAATEQFGNGVELWETRTGHRRWLSDIGYPNGSAIAIAPDGRTMIVGTYGGAVVLLATATGRVLARHTARLQSKITSAEFSSDGKVVAIGGNNGRVNLLTADSLREIGQLPMATGAAWAFVSYDPDGRHLSAVDERGHVAHWDTRPESWIARACATVGHRDFTATEWATYLPGVPHQRTCSKI